MPLTGRERQAAYIARQRAEVAELAGLVADFELLFGVRLATVVRARWPRDILDDALIDPWIGNESWKNAFLAGWAEG